MNHEEKSWIDCRIREAEELADSLFELQNPDQDINEIDVFDLDYFAPLCLAARLNKILELSAFKYRAEDGTVFLSCI